jgi:hypothetical protein
MDFQSQRNSVFRLENELFWNHDTLKSTEEQREPVSDTGCGVCNSRSAQATSAVMAGVIGIRRRA